MKLKALLLITTIFIYLITWSLVYFGGINKLLVQTEDSIPALFTPVSIIMNGSPYLDNYYEMMVRRYPHPDDKKRILGLTPFYLKLVNGHYITAFTLIPPILAVPIFAFPIFSGMEITWFNLALLGKVTSSFVLGISGIILFSVAERFLSKKKSLLLVLVFLFGTINFASISQAFWQHGFVELFAVLSIFIFISQIKEPYKGLLLGVVTGFSALSRPTAAISILIWLMYFIKTKKWEKVSYFFLGVLICGLIFLAYNRVYYFDISNQGYYSQALDSWRTPIYLGLPGMLLSPSKGILIYSPVFFFSIYGAYLSFKKRSENSPIFRISSAIVVVHLLILSMWKHWYGGWSFGYRMAADILPYLTILLVPYFNSQLFQKTKKLFLALFVWSVGVQLMGMAFFDGIWHGVYDKGYKNQAWLWSVENSEIVFNIKRTLVKVGLMKPFI